MNATCPEITEPMMATSSADAETLLASGSPDRTSNFLYQAATVLAILLFLVSF
jgi:hypothetical protein